MTRGADVNATHLVRAWGIGFALGRGEQSMLELFLRGVRSAEVCGDAAGAACFARRCQSAHLEPDGLAA